MLTVDDYNNYYKYKLNVIIIHSQEINEKSYLFDFIVLSNLCCLKSTYFCCDTVHLILIGLKYL